MLVLIKSDGVDQDHVDSDGDWRGDGNYGSVEFGDSGGIDNGSAVW